MSLRKLFGWGAGETAPAASDLAVIRRITDALGRLEPERARYLAAFAYLLARVADADRQISDEETAAMERLVIAHGRLSGAEAVIVVQMAKTQSLLFAGTEDFLVAREFGEMATPEQKFALLECLFAVSSADRHIATVEDNEIRRVARELRVEHADFVRIRSHFREHLGTLRSPDQIE